MANLNAIIKKLQRALVKNGQIVKIGTTQFKGAREDDNHVYTVNPC